MAKHTDHSDDSAPGRDDHHDGRHDDHDHDRRRHARHDGAVDEATARDRFGGLNVGAAFFGWIVAVGVAVLLVGIVGAVLAGVDSSIEITRSDAEDRAGTIGVSAAVIVLVLLAVAYYAGGYVAGRMSRFDGARQGVGVWVIGLLVAVVAGVVGAFFGSTYNVLDRVDVPSIPISSDDLTLVAVIAGIAALVVSLVFAILGGVVGQRYHGRVDRAARV